MDMGSMQKPSTLDLSGPRPLRAEDNRNLSAHKGSRVTLSCGQAQKRAVGRRVTALCHSGRARERVCFAQKPIAATKIAMRATQQPQRGGTTSCASRPSAGIDRAKCLILLNVTGELILCTVTHSLQLQS